MQRDGHVRIRGEDGVHTPRRGSGSRPCPLSGLGLQPQAWERTHPWFKARLWCSAIAAPGHLHMGSRPHGKELEVNLGTRAAVSCPCQSQPPEALASSPMRSCSTVATRRGRDPRSGPRR